MYEKVNPAHPDKVADRIAGAVVDIAYKKNTNPKIACEVLIGHGTATVITETSEQFSDEEIIAVVDRIAGKQREYIIRTVQQDKHLAENQAFGVCCGDNGIFRGVPTTDEQHKLANIAGAIYMSVPHDGKYVLTDTDLFVCQSNTDDQTEDIIRMWASVAADDRTQTFNPLGRWTGGLDVDTGATNRKLGSDMGDAVTGGGLHGKDLSKADVSVNLYLWKEAQRNQCSYEAFCAIGEDYVDVRKQGEETFKPVAYKFIVEDARRYVEEFGGFERLAEWGLIRPAEW